MKNSRSRRMLLAGLPVLAGLGAMNPLAPARADTLWYNGNYDFDDAATNQKVPINFGGTGTFITSLVYDDFVVPVGQSWSVSSVYSNNQIAYYAAATTATWQIRSGMSAGLGGTLVASGDTAATDTLLNAEDDFNYFDPEYKVSAAVTGVTLSAGTYWLAVAPDSTGYYGDQSYNETTSGAGGAGVPTGIDGNSFLYNNLPSDGQQNYVASSLDYSAGVVGTAISVPEPAGMPLLAAGLVGGFFIVRRRRANRNPLVAARGERTRLAPSPQLIETLESRQLMSATAADPAVTAARALRVEARHERRLAAIETGVHTNADAAHHKFNAISIVHVAHAPNQPKVKTQATYAPIPGAYNPTQVRTAYGVSSLALADEGQGMTIGIVDEFDDANITSDADIFSTQYGLPKFDGLGTDPKLTVTKDSALGTVTSAAGTGVALETSLDVEWAHAMAPYANILLVEVPATGNNANAFAELLHGVQLAAADGAQSVSLSYGLTESQIGTSTTVVAQNNTYLAAGAATNTVVTVSSGDGSSPLYPATSPNAIAVGGSSLYLSSVRGKYSYETAWGGLAGAGAGGGGLSTDFPSPTFQSNNKVIFGKRAIPDVAMIADPITGVSVYDSLDVTTSAPSPWTSVGGTSLASPVFAGIVALAQQARVAAGLPILTSVQVNNAIYSAYNSTSYLTYFHDIKQGKDANVSSSGSTTVAGFTAVTGYDEATGVGSPIANTFVPYLASL